MFRLILLRVKVCKNLKSDLYPTMTGLWLQSLQLGPQRLRLRRQVAFVPGEGVGVTGQVARRLAIARSRRRCTGSRIIVGHGL